MGHRSAPPHIEQLFDKPGREWTALERTAFDRWLLVPEQFARDAAIVALILHRHAQGLATQQDVEDVCNEFHGVGLDRVIRNYDPAAGDRNEAAADRFWAYYNTALRNLARKRAEALRSERERFPSIDRPAADDTDSGDVIPDGGLKPDDLAILAERIRMLERCIERVLTEAERELVRARLDEVPFEELAQKLHANAGALRVRHTRALKRLKRCLASAFTPSSPARRPGPGTPSIAVDVLIVGGGVMGLFLLNDLRACGYSAVLLEQDSLGGCQTCHSHLYIHDGHVHGNLPVARRLKQADGLWREWLAGHPEVERAFTPSIFGFRTRRDADYARTLWDHPDFQLQHRKVDLPAVLASGRIEVAYESPEMCLRGQSLIKALQGPVSDCICRVKAVTFGADTTSKDSGRVVDVLLPDNRHVGIRPRAVVLAAGSGNEPLLKSIAASGRGTTCEPCAAQQIRQGHMLVVRGRGDRLPLLTGVFYLSRTLFIVARSSGDDVVWLVSDNRSPCRDPGAKDADSLRWWCPGVANDLRELAPSVFAHPRNLEWFGYTAPKAELRTPRCALPDGPGIVRCGSDVWAVWPTKLTLAPLASLDIMAQMTGALGAGRGGSLPSTWLTARCDAPSALERWQEAAPAEWKRTGVCE